MKTNRFKHAVVITALAAALTANGSASADQSNDEIREGAGFGLGALIGSLAGPVGMAFGAATGALIARNEIKEEKLALSQAERVAAEAELVASQSAMAQLKESIVASNDSKGLFKGGLEARHYSLEVLFRTASHDIESKYRPALNDLATLLDEHPELAVNLEGHSDNRGDADYNLALSERRIDAVKQALIDHGVGGDRITATAHGEAQSAGAERDIDGWALERRVSVSVSNPKAAQGVAEAKF